MQRQVDVAVSPADISPTLDAPSAIDASPPIAPPPTTSAPPEGFAARSARGGIIMTAVQIASSLISFASQIALAWFLLPEDFGTVAVAVSISGLVAVLRDAGAPAILIQRQNEFDRIAGSVFWMTLGGATLCALLTAGAAPFVAASKHSPILLPVLLLTALRFPIGALGTISSVRLSVDLRWGAVAGVNLLQPLVTSIGAVLMAWRGWGVYSLVIPPIIADAARGFAAWLVAGGHVRLRPDMTLISGIIVSSAFIILTNLTLAARSVGDYLTLSFLTANDHETGLYFYAFTMAQALSRLALGAGPSVLAPVFSKVKHDESRHADIMIRAMHMFAVIGVIAIVMQASMAWPLFRLFLNPKWVTAAPLFCIVSLMILACFLNNVIFQAMWASGFYRQFFWYSAAFTPVMVLMFIVGTKTAGATGVAWANVLGGVLDFIIFPMFALPMLKVPWRRAILPLWRPLLAAAPTALIAFALHRTLPATRTADALCIAIIGVAGSAAYLLILWFVWRGMVVAAWTHLSNALGLAK